VSFMRRLFGGAPDQATEATEATEAESPPADEDELSEDLKSFLYPQDEFIQRQQRYARYKWEPPPNEKQREPRLARLGELLARTRQPTDEQIALVVKAYGRRPRSFDETLSALRERARASGRASDLAAAAGLSLGDPDDPENSPELPEAFIAAVEAAATLAAVHDLADSQTLVVLTGPWQEGFGPLPD
jgi:hypothetical protein